MNVFELSRSWFNWCFENPDKISPNHTAMYFFIIEHCNRLGWKDKFGLPTTMVKDAIGIRNYRTYINTLNDLVDFGFIKIIEKSKNQYSSNIIAIVKNAKANAKALDKALQKHSQKQCKSIASIDIQETIEQETIYRQFQHLKLTDGELNKLVERGYSKEQVDNILNKIENYSKNKKYKSLYLTALDWLKKEVPAKAEKKEPVSGSPSELLEQGINDFYV